MADTNGIPTGVADTGVVSEDDVLSATGNVLSNDTDPENNSLSVTAINGQAANVGATIAGTYGSLVLGANGAYTYTLNNSAANVQALSGGQTVTDVFSYTLSDGFTHTTTTNVPATNKIIQSEAFDSSAWTRFGSPGTVSANVGAGPAAAGATGTTADQIQLNGTDQGLYYVNNVTGQHTFSIWVKLISGNGSFALNYWSGSSATLQNFTATSEWQQFTLTFTGSGNSSANLAFMHYLQTSTGVFQLWGAQLNAGATAGPYVATTGSAVTTTVPVDSPAADPTSTLTISVSGANESGTNASPAAVADTASVSEDNVLSATGNVLSNDTDADNDTLTVLSVNGQSGNVGSTITGTYGSLVLGANGAYTYTLNNSAAAVQALTTGQTVTEVFNYVATDGKGGTSASTLTVNVGGADEPAANALPTGVADTASVSEDNALTATGNVLANDTDPENNSLTVSAVNGSAANVGATITGLYGTLVINANGAYTYTLANSQANVQALASGQSVTEVFNYTLSDGFTHTTTTNVAARNLITQSEAFNAAPWGRFGSVSTVTADVASGPTSAGATGTTADQVTLSGSNQGLYYTSTVTGQHTFSIWVKLVSGSGSFSLNYWNGSNSTLQNFTATSDWQQYTLTFTGTGNASANLAFMHNTQTATGVFQIWGAELNPGATADPYVATTGSAVSTTVPVETNASASSTLTVTVNGANEAGQNAAPAGVADTASVTEDAVTTATGNVLSNDTDPENDSLSVTAINGQAANVGATIAGTYGTLVLGANGAYTYTLNNTAANVQALANGQTVTDAFTYTLSDGLTHTTTTNVPATNKIIQSEAFNSSAWTRFGSAGTVSANVASGPTAAGATGTTADQIQLNGTDQGLYYVNNVSGQHTFSIWVKLVSGNGSFSLNYWSGTGSTLQTFTATNEWQKFTLTFTGSGNSSANLAFMHYTQTATGVFQLWGAQLNAGATSDPYVATTGSAVSTTVPVESTAANPTATLTVSVHGADEGATNTAPVATADTASVSEDNVLSATGNVLTNDTDANNDALTVATVNGQAANVGATIAGTYGTLVLGANGAYTYTLNNTAANVQALAAGQTVTEVFNYGISDGKGGTAASTLTVSVGGADEANVAPVATADTASVSEDNVLSATGNVLTNDTDANNDTLTVATVNGQAANVGATIAGTYGTLVLGANGAYTYTLNNTAANVQALAAGQTVTEVFNYGISDGKGGTAASTLTVSVGGADEANVAPVATADTASVSEDNVLSATGNVLTNDTDANNDTLTVATVNGQAANVGATIAGTYGTLVLGANGAYTYTLNNTAANVQALAAGQTVTEVFNYGISDGKGGTSASTLTVSVGGADEANVAPVATADTASVSEDNVLSATGNVLTNDTDANNDTLTVATVNGQAANVGATIAGTYGTLVLGANGAYTYTLNNTAANVQALAAGQTVTEVFNYGISDGKGGTSASTLTVSVGGADEANAAPVATADTASVSEDNVLSATGNVLTNDTDANNDALTVATVNGQAANVGATIAGTYGTLVLGANGAYTYTLNNSAANVQALAAGQTVTEVFNYGISDGKGGTSASTLTVSVGGGNDAPVTMPDIGLVEEDASIAWVSNVLGNDIDADNDSLSVVSINGQAANVGATVVGTYGSLVLSANGNYTYTLANSQANVQMLIDGERVTEVFDYGISDGNGGASTSTLTIWIDGADDANVAPVVVSDTASVSEDNVLSASGNVLTNDTDANGDTLTVAAVNSQAGNVGVTTNGAYGSLVLGSNGAYIYTLNNSAANVQALAAGQTVTDLFTYAVSDGKGGTTASTLTVSVAGADEVNTAPVATADTASVSEDNVLSATGNVLTNDTDANNDALTVATVNGQAANVGATIAGTYGSLVLGANGAYTYTLNNSAANVQALAAGQTVTEVFNYGISDGKGGTSASTLTVSVGGADEANVAPVATADTASVSEDNVLSATGNVLTNDTDANNDTLTVATVNGQAANVGATITGTYGTLVLGANGAYTYTLNNTAANVQALAAGQTVTEVFNYGVSDGKGGTSASTLTVSVGGADEANAAPVATADTASVSEDNVLSATGNVLTNDTDANNDTLTVATVNGQAANVGATINGTYGTLVLGANGAYTYTLNNNAANVQALAAGQTVTEVFNYGISDGKGGNSASTLTVSVGGANDAPVATANTATVSEDGVLTATGNVLTNDTDKDLDTLTVATVNGQAANVGATITGTYGSLVLGANGAYTYTLNNSAANVQALNAGQTVTEVFNYEASDGKGGTSASTLTVSVNGAADNATNAAPSASVDAASVSEDNVLSATGNVLTNDTDPENNTLSVAAINGQAANVGATINGTYGSLVLGANGAYTYTLNNSAANVQSLSAGQFVTDVFSYTLSDGFTHSTTTNVSATNKLTQSEAFNSSPWTRFGAASTVSANVASGPSAAGATGTTADQITLNTQDQGLYYTTNVSGTHTFSVWVKLVSGNGQFDLNYWNGTSGSTLKTFVATSEWQQFSLTFTGTGNSSANLAFMHFQETIAGTFQLWGAQLNAGSTPDPYLATTGSAVTTTVEVTTPTVVTSTLTVTIDGANEAGFNAAPSAVADTGAVSEDNVLSATGNVLTNDSDPENDTLSVAAINGQAANVGATIAGTYGSLVLGANGAYTYTLNNSAANVQALAGGQTVTETFSYTLSDGKSHTTTTNVPATNKILQSEGFNNASWGKFGPTASVTANVAQGPTAAGATGSTADQITVAGQDAGMYQVTNVSGQHTFSIWVKLVSGDGHFNLNYWNGSGSTLKAFVATSEWQQFTLTFNGSGSSQANLAFMHFQETASGTFQVWGAQLNEGASVDPYVATTASAVSTTVPVTTYDVPTSTLTIEVAGANESGPTALSFAGTSDGHVVDLTSNEWAVSTKVLALGDSITYGANPEDTAAGTRLFTGNGYRGPLWESFVNNGGLIDFVGPETAGSDELLDRSHAGYSGYRVDQIDDQLISMTPNLIAAGNVPDIVLVMAGTNDIFQDANPVGQVSADLPLMLSSIQSLNPEAHIYVATLLPIGVEPYASLVPQVNAAIVSLVNQAKANGMNITLVDTSSMTTADLFDGTHPSEAGYAKLAQIWYDAILAEQPVVGGTPAGTATPMDPNVNSVTGGSGNDLFIADDGTISFNGGAGNDRLVTGSGTATLTGGTGYDTFVISSASGSVTITDFSQAQDDHIELSGIAGLASFANLTGHISQTGGNTVIDLSSFGATSSIVLTGVTSTLTADDFFFS